MFILEIVNHNFNNYLAYIQITCNQLVTIYYVILFIFTNLFSNQLYKHHLFIPNHFQYLFKLVTNNQSH